MKEAAFTMAEILLSLTIIGVVAAITLPSLTGNINERTWNTQRKALYARMSQAISLMPALNGFGTVTSASGTSGTESYVPAVDTAAETFLTAGLSKVLKINNICDNSHLADCGIVSSITDMTGSNVTVPTTLYNLDLGFSSVAYCGLSYSAKDTKSAAFETQNGESIIAYYNPSCRTEFLELGLSNAGNKVGFAESAMCANFIYDLNGSKGPNTVGKDIGIMTVFNATDSIVVAPMPTSARNAGGDSATYKWKNAAKACTTEDSESRIPNINELSAMTINRNILNLNAEEHLAFWSGTVDSSETAWFIHTHTGVKGTDLKTWAIYVRCVKR